MHPRAGTREWDEVREGRARDILAFMREHGPAHPRVIEEHFAHGKVQNYWGGSSNATTHLLDGMHYRGMLRVARRESGTRVYAAWDPPAAWDDPAEVQRRLDALIDVAIGCYAPLPSRSMTPLLRRLRYAVPQWRDHLGDAIARARSRLAHVRIDGIDWYWPPGERPRSARHRIDERLRLLTPFDPIVWDRVRFEMLWGWAYRFEAYTPASKRKLGYYALPMLWGEHVIGHANATVVAGRLRLTVHPRDRSLARDRTFMRALADEKVALQAFLGLPVRRGTARG